MVVFTTINPNGNFEAQNEAMSSWSSKFTIYSVNTKNDIDKIKDIYPYVNFIETEDTYIYKGKELIKLNALLEAIKSSDKEYACIVNSDIILNSNIDISYLLKNKYLDKGLIIATRYELDGEKEPYPFTDGYDMFIFNKKNVNLFLNKNYVIGMPWWDYWIPIISNIMCKKKPIAKIIVSFDLPFNNVPITRNIIPSNKLSKNSLFKLILAISK